MVGIVIASHSQKLSEGVIEVARMMAENAPLAAAGGMENGDLGTSYDKILNAIDKVYSDDGVVILADMGSAVMTAEMVLEDIEYENIKILNCPLVEGAILAAMESVEGRDLEDLAERVETAHPSKKLMDD
ncbi:MAG: PTS-dependent dihydroxyacetone kinase phosphotransferase subunit DhaM [Selenomonadaceae bacterium]|nr:PTS-dependent dihydroxyacetone kinase phosphotransferase subunit DhaM [Selenomonadaceae bacterium]